MRHVDTDAAVFSALDDIGREMVVLDAPARISKRTVSVLQVSNVALVPVRPSGLDLWGTAEFLDVLTDHVGRDLSAAFVASQADIRTSLSDHLETALSRLDLSLLDGLIGA